MPVAAPEIVVEEKPVIPEVVPAFSWAAEDSPLVLVVEDDLPTSELLTIHLTQAGYRVAHAYDGIEAIEKAGELQPFVITLDIMLPKKMAGRYCSLLRQIPEQAISL